MNSTAAGVIVSDGKVRSGQGNTLVVFGFLISNISRFLAVFNRTAGLLFKKMGKDGYRGDRAVSGALAFPSGRTVTITIRQLPRLSHERLPEELFFGRSRNLVFH
jgi:hypothetical protein